VSEVKEGSSYGREVLDEATIEVNEAYKDQNVVQVHYDNPFRYDGSEDVIHHSLEGSRAVGHSKEYYEGFKEVLVGAKGHFPLISGLDAYIIETPVDIQFCEVTGSAELGDKLGDKGKRIFVLDSYGVQSTVVLD